MHKILRRTRQAAKKVRNQFLRIYYGAVSNHYQKVGYDVECNLCHYKNKKLKNDNWHENVGCPYCGSNIRLRLLWASLTQLHDFSLDKIVRNKKILHFAPEPALTGLLRKNAGVYKSADYLAEGYDYLNLDYNLDMSNMKNIGDAEFDCIIACDVLEHIPDHKGAMKEAHRVLRKGGWCIFTVPQKDGLDVTYEDLSDLSPQERLKKFGQSDHLRIYGNDFPQLLSECGFKVTAVDETFFDKEFATRHVLYPSTKCPHPLATNFRKVFFGEKL